MLFRSCPPPPPVCNQCPDGSFVCPGVDCIGGQCVLVGECQPTAAGCPPSPPVHGSACTPPETGGGFDMDFAHCSWGDDPRVECRITALCESSGTGSGSWQVTPTMTYCSTPPLPADCPSLPPSGVCANGDPACWYGDGTHCFCSECLGGSEYPSCQVISPPQWACQSPPAGCPATTPQAGTACIEPGLDCSPRCDLQVICDAGVWQWKVASCPICASPDTPIATPEGERPIADLVPGDLVYSVHGGAIVPVPVLRAESTQVGTHRVMRVRLESGAVLELSPGHPTADGRLFGDIGAGDRLDELNRVVSSELVPYRHDRTYDILPASDTGAYFASGALVGSTLRRGM